MKACECGGELYRHGTTRGKTGNGYRYRCRECGTTITAPIDEDTITGKLRFPGPGRPTLKDWRYAK